MEWFTFQWSCLLVGQRFRVKRSSTNNQSLRLYLFRCWRIQVGKSDSILYVNSVE
jgi:hypothetical protein